MYKVFIESHAEKDLDALDKSFRKKVIERLLLLKHNPRPAGSKKLVDSGNAWRLRFGNWRALYEVNDKKQEIRIYRLKQRDEAYQP